MKFNVFDCFCYDFYFFVDKILKNDTFFYKIAIVVFQNFLLELSNLCDEW